MANHDLVLGPRRELPLVQNQHLGLRRNRDLVIGRSGGLELGEGDEHGLDLGHSLDSDLGLGHDRGLMLDHELGLPHDQRRGDEHEDGYENGNEDDTGYDEHENRSLSGLEPGGDDDPDVEPDGPDMDHDERQLVVSAEHEQIGLSENHELSVVENHGLDENLDLVVQHNHDMGIVSGSDMSFHQSHLVVTTPIIQTRTLVPAPTYELAVGQEFPDVKSCRRALRDCAIALHFEIQTVKSDKTRFTAKCASEGCPWRIHAAKLPGIYVSIFVQSVLF